MASNVALMGVAGRDCYTAVKGGIAAITCSMAVEFADLRPRTLPLPLGRSKQGFKPRPLSACRIAARLLLRG
jgi:hypothetical protein